MKMFLIRSNPRQNEEEIKLFVVAVFVSASDETEYYEMSGVGLTPAADNANSPIYVNSPHPLASINGSEETPELDVSITL